MTFFSHKLLVSRILSFGTACALFLQNCNQPEKRDALGTDPSPDFIEYEFRRLVNPYTGEVPGQLRFQSLLSKDWVLGGNGHLEKSSTYPFSWTAVDDFFASLAVTDIAFDPNQPRIMYFSTGEGRYNADASRGCGIWKSLDGGNSWSQLPSTQGDSFYYCQTLHIHPVGSVLYAGTNSGLYRSSDGGVNWQLVLGRGEGSSRSHVADVEIAADGGIFASFGSIAERGTVYHSESGEAGTWVERAMGLPIASHRIELACAPSDPNRLYAIPVRNEESNRRIFGVYRSDNGGISWNMVTDPGGDKELAAQQGWYDLILQVHPHNPDFVLAGGLNIWRSANGGNSWQQLSEGRRRIKSDLPYVHVDQHEIVFMNADTVLFGNDGGIYICEQISAQTPLFTERNDNYNATQFYTGRIAQKKGSHFLLGGTQDNGSLGATGSGISRFDQKSWADGSFCAINHIDPDIFFTTTQYRRMYRHRHGIIDTLSNPYITDKNTQFINPMMMDPNDPDLIYQASNLGIWRLSNAGSSDSTQWQKATRPFGVPAAMALAKDVPNLGFFAMYNSGRVFKLENLNTTDQGSAPIDMDPLAFLPRPERINPSCIAVNPLNANHLIITYSNYGVAHVWETRNALSGVPVWHRIDGNLPDLPVHWAIISPLDTNVCYLATELGVKMTSKLNDSSTIWESLEYGLANLRVSMLDIRPADRTILAATHGRGMYTGIIAPNHRINWEERGPSNVGGRTRSILPDPLDSLKTKVWAGSVSGGLWSTQNIHRLHEYTEDTTWKDFNPVISPNPVREHFRVSLETHLRGSVQLELFDLRGRLVRSFEIPDSPNFTYDRIFPRAGLGCGLYLLRIRLQSEEKVIRLIFE